VAVPGSVDDVEAVLVTGEPPGGSDVPTGTLLMTATLSVTNPTGPRLGEAWEDDWFSAGTSAGSIWILNDAVVPQISPANTYVADPAGGPSFYPLDENARYYVKVDNTGDGREDVAYRWDPAAAEFPASADEQRNQFVGVGADEFAEGNPLESAASLPHLVSTGVFGSSHREAPGILKDPTADNTDVYSTSVATMS
jgi:Domain of unknown function (DUF4331)